MQQKALFVELVSGQLPAELVEDRRRTRILRVQDGRYANIVKGSAPYRHDPGSKVEQALWLARNRRAWRHLSQQTHPGLLRVWDRVVDTYGDEGYLCERLSVFSLCHSDHPARRSLRSFLECGIQLAQAAGVMHTAGFVHGDLTPSNVCFDARGRPVLIDYEMSVRVGQVFSLRKHGSAAKRIYATPSCCSPEQALCELAAPASDVFCIGLTLLSWLSERFGVDGTYRNQSINESLRLCSRAEYPYWELVEERVTHPDVLCVLQKCIELVPVDRYECGNQLAQDFEKLLCHIPSEDLDLPLALPRKFFAPASAKNSTFSLDHL